MPSPWWSISTFYSTSNCALAYNPVVLWYQSLINYTIFIVYVEAVEVLNIGIYTSSQYKTVCWCSSVQCAVTVLVLYHWEYILGSASKINTAVLIGVLCDNGTSEGDVVSSDTGPIICSKRR